MTTAQACARLGVKPATLYAYVPRGLLRSEPGPAGTRERRYMAADVEALHGRREARRDPQGAVRDAVGGALHWGAPVLDSALTQVSGGRLAYRGEDAVVWAAHAGAHGETGAELVLAGQGRAWPKSCSVAPARRGFKAGARAPRLSSCGSTAAHPRPTLATPLPGAGVRSPGATVDNRRRKC